MAEQIKITEEPEPVWITATGQPIPVSEMTTSHLMNAGRLMYRRYLEAMADVAQIEADLPYGCAPEEENREFVRMGDVMYQADGSRRWLEIFIAELERRGVRVDALRLRPAKPASEASAHEEKP